jgi:hypothetical protein
MTNLNSGYTSVNSEKDGYHVFEESLQKHFDEAISGGTRIFTTDVQDRIDLYDLYLSSFPTEEARQHYTCHACRHFIQRFGGLVTIDEKGNAHSVIWKEDGTPEYFLPAVKAVKKEVLKSRVNGVFLPDSRVLGQPKTGEWTHLHIRLPQEMTNRNILRNSHQAMAEKKESFSVLSRSISDYGQYADQGLQLVESETLYRGDSVKGMAQFFKRIVDEVANYSGDQKRNIIWKTVAEVGKGLSHVRGSKYGSIILKGIAEETSTRVISLQFKQAMSTNMRSQRDASELAIIQAEELIEKMELGDSLSRRYAKFDEIPESEMVWKDSGVVTKSSKEESKSTGVFGHLKSQAKKNNDTVNLPSSVMTFEKFKRTVLPGAEKLEVLMDNPSRFMAMVTAANPDAKQILQWDNPFSWYYHGGIDGEIQRRVEEAGGRYKDNEIRASLIWEGPTDLDLHCITPSGNHIYYGEREGILDVDANGGRITSLQPVENMRWISGAREGRYKFYVHNFAQRANNDPVPFKVELEINGKVYAFNGTAGRTGWQQDVFEFRYQKGKDPEMLLSNHSTQDVWGVETNSFVKVKGITTSPNMWGENPRPQTGHHYFFLLEGLQDEAEGKGRGFFNEMLKSELHEIRRTLEMFTANTPVEGAEEADACGVGFIKDVDWNLTVRVTNGSSSRIVKIDRFD